MSSAATTAASHSVGGSDGSASVRAGVSSAPGPVRPSPSISPDGAGAVDNNRIDRALLRRVGTTGGTVVVAAGGAVSCSASGRHGLSRRGARHYNPWQEWHRDAGPLALVSAAVLAARPHASQVWAFAIDEPGLHVDIYADHARPVGAPDPLDRDLHIALGCALENLEQAAVARGYGVDVQLRPTAGDRVYLARVALHHAGRPAADLPPLYDAIDARRTDRGPYAPRPLTREHRQDIAALARGVEPASVHWITRSEQRALLGRLMVAAAQAVTCDEQQAAEEYNLSALRAGSLPPADHAPIWSGADLSAAVASLAATLPPSGREAGNRHWVRQTRDVHVKTAAAYGVVMVPDASSITQRVAGGQLLERAQLWMQTRGLALHHMHQLTERIDCERDRFLTPHFTQRFGAILPAGRQPLAIFRAGYPHQQLADVVLRNPELQLLGDV